MRVLVVSHMFASSLSPDDVFIYSQTRALADQGVEVRVLQPIPWAPCPLRCRSKWRRYHLVAQERSWGGLLVARVPYPRPPSGVLQPLAAPLLVAPLLRALRLVRRSFDFQVIHAHALTPDGFAAVLAGRVLHSPVVVSARGSDVHTYPRRSAWIAWETRYALTRCHALVAVSQELARQARTLAPQRGLPEVVYNGVDAALFAPCEDKAQIRLALGLPADGTIALAVGALIPEKGTRELSQAFERMGRAHPELRLVVVGGGPLRAELEALGERMGRSRLILPGVVPNPLVADYMRAADMLLHPSHAEGLPNVVLEAMATELPVVAAAVGGTPEVVTTGETGLLFEARDSRALEVHLAALLADRQLARRMGKAGRARVLDRHSWGRNAREHIRIYQALCDKP